MNLFSPRLCVHQVLDTKDSAEQVTGPSGLDHALPRQVGPDDLWFCSEGTQQTHLQSPPDRLSPTTVRALQWSNCMLDLLWTPFPRSDRWLKHVSSVKQGWFVYLESPRELYFLSLIRSLGHSVICAQCPMFLIFFTSSSLLTPGISVDSVRLSITTTDTGHHQRVSHS